jgi:hypothetical protein
MVQGFDERYSSNVVFLALADYRVLTVCGLSIKEVTSSTTSSHYPCKLSLRSYPVIQIHTKASGKT